MAHTDDDEKPAKPKLPLWVKIAGALIPIIGSALGSYKAAREENHRESQASYETLAPTVAQLSQAVADMNENQKRLWDLYIRVLSTQSKPAGTDTDLMHLRAPADLFDPPGGSAAPGHIRANTGTHGLLRPPAAPRFAGSGLRGLAGLGAIGHGAGGGGGESHGLSIAPLTLGSAAPTSYKPAMEDAPKSVPNVAPPPKSFGEAVRQWEQKSSK